MFSFPSFWVDGFSASLFFVLKFFLSILLGFFYHRRWKWERLSSLVAGWLTLQAVQLAIVLGLSVFGKLTSSSFLITVILLSFLFVKMNFNKEFIDFIRSLFPKVSLPFVFLVFFICLLWLRSLVLFDFTWDAQVYEYPRIALWLNTKSILTHQSTPQLNLFTNEWTGEINALAYALAGGRFQGCSLGNLEALIWLFVSIGWLATLLGSSSYWSMFLSILLGSSPATLGLATTMKGDLMAVVGFLMTAGWVFHISKNISLQSLGMLLLAAVFSVSSKISVVLPTFSLVILGLFAFLRYPDAISITKNSIGAVVGILISVVVISSRFWINLFVYGNPVQRVATEKPSLSFENLSYHLTLFLNKIFNIKMDAFDENLMWSLSVGMGASALVVVVVFFSTFLGNEVREKVKSLKQWSKIYFVEACVPSPLLFVLWIFVPTLISMGLYVQNGWSFRYFLPTALVFLVGYGSLTFCLNQSIEKKWWVKWLLLMALMVNFFMAFLRKGEVIPFSTLSQLSRVYSQAETYLKRMSAYVRGPYYLTAADTLHLDSARSLRILLYQELDTAILPFLGSRAQNQATSVASIEELLRKATQSHWDIVAITKKKSRRDFSQVQALEELGYWIGVDNGFYLIGLPLSRVHLNLIHKIENQSSFEGAHDSTSCLVLGEVNSNQSLYVSARFDGILENPRQLTNQSIHGVNPIFDLDSRDYKKEEKFQAVVPSTGVKNKGQYCFQLVGVNNSKSLFRLTELSVYELNIDAYSKGGQ